MDEYHIYRMAPNRAIDIRPALALQPQLQPLHRRLDMLNIGSQILCVSPSF